MADADTQNAIRDIRYEERRARKESKRLAKAPKYSKFKLAYRMITNGSFTERPSIDPNNTKYGNTIVGEFNTKNDVLHFIEFNSDERLTHGRLYAMYGTPVSDGMPNPTSRANTYEYVYSLSYRDNVWQKIKRDYYSQPAPQYTLHKLNINGDMIQMPGAFNNLEYLQNYIRGRERTWHDPGIPELDPKKTYWIYQNNSPLYKCFKKKTTRVERRKKWGKIGGYEWGNIGDWENVTITEDVWHFEKTS